MKARTRAGRLRALDRYLVEREPALLAAAGPAPFIDVGFGEHPTTTLEARDAFRKLNPELRTIGLERELDRALAAARFEDRLTRFAHGDFGAMPLLPRARLVRAMNVLRSYSEDEARAAHRVLGAALIEGGLLVEGSADPAGDLLSAHLIRRRGAGIVREGLLFQTTFAHGFAPVGFRDWLPRDLRRRVKPGEWIHALFARWTEAWEAVRGAEPRASFVAAAGEWARRGEPLDSSMAERGYLIWKPPGGVPE